MASTITKFAHLQIPLEEVLKATNNFHDNNIIGRGGFGPAYKGRLLWSGKLMKISARRLDRKHGEGDVEFWTEISLLFDLKHTNLVSIIGFCDEKDEKIIITTYEANGSLEEHLNRPDLTWTQRLKISLGVARALSYLHYDAGRGYGVIQRNINSSTILLDENWEAKLSGFEISIKQSANRMDRVILSEPIGTIGYMDPEAVKTKGVTHKSDIYSFGVVLFEILSGRRAYIKNDANKFLARLAKYHYENETLQDIIHPDLRNQMSPGSLRIYSKIAYSCLEKELALRPHILVIVDKLEKALKTSLKFQPHFGKNLEHLMIPLDDIKSATNNFSDAYITEFNDYYTWYTVELDYFNKEKPYSLEGKSKTKRPKRRNSVYVWIKRFLPMNDEDNEDLFFTELEMLTSVKHHNIVTLLGFCVEGCEMMLVIESLFNGCPMDCFENVKDVPILTWEKRLKICIDVAHALSYLHSKTEGKKMVIHSNINAYKIRLDENWKAKIDDFEWAVILPPNQNDEFMCKRTYFESKYHMDPVYMETGKLKTESDVYSFGVVMLEILCGRCASDRIYLRESEKGLVHVARRNFSSQTPEDMIDPSLKEETGKKNKIPNRNANKDSLHIFFKIANECVAETQDQRPSMEVVLKELEKALFFQLNPVVTVVGWQARWRQWSSRWRWWMCRGGRWESDGVAASLKTRLFLKEERVQQPNKDHVVDELEIASHEITDEGIQLPDTDKVGKSLELWLVRESIEMKLGHLKIRLSDIKLATDHFSQTYTIATWEGFTLYRAELDHFDKTIHSSKEWKNKGQHPKRHSTVIIKRYISRHRFIGEEKFLTEIEMLTRVKHPNIVTLLGFCIEDSEMILVMENVSNEYLVGYLGDVNDMRVLTWEKRLKICIDVAHALKYIHYDMGDQKMIINCDICSENIGLDEKWGAKIVSFFLAVYLPPNQVHQGLSLDNYIGRSFNMDPDLKRTNKLKRESDVYGFGVFLLEILCGRVADDKNYTKEGGLASVARRSFCAGTLGGMIDPTLKEETSENNFILNRGPNKDSLNKFIEIAYQCVAETQDQRPSMKVVVKELEKALFFQINKKDNPIISLEDIKVATQNFHNDNCIGRGGFGGVFKGNLEDGDGYKTIVAKRLDIRLGQGENQFLTELQILLEYKHENVIGLIGYCDEQDEKIIVYEYASRGSVDRYLSDASLTWVKRLNICIDIASALDFLHGGIGKQARVIHRDIKTGNILLNHDWKALLADFGLSLISPLTLESDYIIDHACGTIGYLDPLYKKSAFLTMESDIYSFGVVLFEILCGRSTFEIKKHNGHYLPDFIKKNFEERKHDEVVFEHIREQIVPKSLTTFQEISYQCLHHEREKRPSTKKVLMEVKKALEFQNMASTMTKFVLLKIPLEEVVKATNNFHVSNIIRHCTFGTTYKGRLLRSGRLMKIAARRFDCKHREADLKFMTEISVLYDLKHTNLVSVIGFCDEHDEKIIVTTYEANGSLVRHLNSPNLTWTQRLRICVGVARALSYLHSDKGRDYGIIHCNINSDTILLDEKWEAKLSSFEISIKQSVHNKDQVYLCEHSGVTGYMDPTIEKMGGVTYKSDIYSFGVFLFELFCGREAFIQNGANRLLAPLAKYHYENGTLQDIIHPDLHWNRISPQSLLKYSNIAYSCLNEDQADRPNMAYIVVELEKALELQLRCDNIGNNLEHLKIRLSDIKLATDNFSETYIIASWKYNLYRAELGQFDKDNPSSVTGKDKGKHPKSHKTVVIKRYPRGHLLYTEERFFTEIEMLSSVKHGNIVALLGFCVESPEMIIITENVSNGYLFDYLGKANNMRIFTWQKRLKVCIDVARALNYLHSEMEDQKMIINCDISSYSIGLGENLKAKIVDFWFSVFLPPNQEDEALYPGNWVGRLPYVDPEYKTKHKLKRESDVYSFGVVLLEILCGRTAEDPIYKKGSDKGLASVARRCYRLGTLHDIIDPIIKEEVDENKFVFNRGPNKDSLQTFISIAHQCVTETQDQRPTMRVVVKELEKALFLQDNTKNNPRIRLEDVKLATQNFHEDNCIGGEGFGKVYRGNLQDGYGVNSIVAKQLDTRFAQGENQFFSELQILWEYKHENIISLVGYCDEQDEKIIVYEFACRRSLELYLNDASLTWVKRLNICIDVANALDFIHGGVGKQTNVIHGNIKTANILLNHDWKAKLAGFGFSLISPITRERRDGIYHPCGTQGYVDPLYSKSESDIYSFGVVLFEILCGRSTISIYEHEGHHLSDFIESKFKEGRHDEVVFEQIREQIVLKSLTTFQNIAYQCLHHEREKRPTTKRVLTQLKKALEIQNMAFTITKFAHLQIPLDDVAKATNKFHRENIIEQGVFGTTYKGQLLRCGRLMKITARRFDCKNGEADLGFLMEISVLVDLKHTNVISVVGFCDEGDNKIIVTTYEANGSLGQHLNNPNLTWMQRLRICVGVARALSYIHYEEGRDYGIIHCNINSDTILLDENWEAKLSSFESSIKQSVYNKDQVYLCDPTIEKMGGVTYKSDIYAFGVVLFEMLCGRKAFIQNEVKSFLAPIAKYHYENKTLQDIIHPDLRSNQMSPQALLKYSYIAYSCLNEDRVDRLYMNYIVDELEKALELQLQCENIGNNLEHMKIPLKDIILATDNFSDTCIAKFGYYYKWYRGELGIEGKSKGVPSKIHNTVLIKRLLPRDDEQGEEVFYTEIEKLSTSVEHHNIVSLLGFCIEGSEMILVIDDVSNGLLGDYLSNFNGKLHILTWEKRLKICIDVAHAFDYLHSKREGQETIVIRFINCNGIGLDENWRAKIVWFGNSVFMPMDQEDEALYPNASSNARFMKYYIDPEYKMTRKLTKESDIYSFGVVLFEILCGRRAFDPIYLKESDKGLAHVARRSFSSTGTLEDMIDPIIMEETNEHNSFLYRGPNKDSLHAFIEIAHQCVAETQDQRPAMKVVIKELHKALFFQENNKNAFKIPLEDIKLATQNFHDDNCICRKGIGKVYIGNLQDGDGFKAIVANRLDTSFGQREKQFLSELQILLEYKHENVIGLVGYCDEQDEKIIVYEYASRGSLCRYLNDASLTWVKRLNICIDVASALDFIHGGVGKQTKVIHGDVKTANILLNHDWKAKLADFGLSLISRVTQETEYVIDYACGTKGYVDPLYEISGFLTMESDIYSFGVVLFEILCGRSTFAIHEYEGHHLPDFIKNIFEEGKHDEVVFEQIREQIVPESLTAFQKIAYQCLHHEREKRPTTKEILSELKMALEFQCINISRKEEVEDYVHSNRVPAKEVFMNWTSQQREYFVVLCRELQINPEDMDD